MSPTDVTSPQEARVMLGEAIKKIRVSKKMDRAYLASRLGWSVSKVSRTENGVKRLDAEELGDIIFVFKPITPEQRSMLLALLRKSHEREWWRSKYAGALTPDMRRHTSLEGAATSIRAINTYFLHGLLQSEMTIREAMAVTFPDDAALRAKRIQFRIDRKRVLLPSHGLKFHVLMDEVIFMRNRGSRAARIEQIEYLIELSEQENITIQITPLSAPMAALTPTDRDIMEFSGADKPVIYAEGSLVQTFSTSHIDYKASLGLWETVMSVSLSEEESRNYFVKTLGELKMLNGERNG